MYTECSLDVHLMLADLPEGGRPGARRVAGRHHPRQDRHEGHREVDRAAGMPPHLHNIIRSPSRDFALSLSTTQCISCAGGWVSSFTTLPSPSRDLSRSTTQWVLHQWVLRRSSGPPGQPRHTPRTRVRPPSSKFGVTRLTATSADSGRRPPYRDPTAAWPRYLMYSVHLGTPA